MISHSVRVAALVAALLAVPGLQAAEVAGVKLDEQIKVGAGELVLNGAGLRTKVFVKVYVGALYVTQKSNTPAGLLDAATPRRMSLRMLRDIDSDSEAGRLSNVVDGHGWLHVQFKTGSADNASRSFKPSV